MARDPLRVLMRLRGIEVDSARRMLADRLREETVAEARAAGIAANVVREIGVQEHLPGDGWTVDSYVGWLRGAHTDRGQAHAAVRACAAAAAEARVSLGVARSLARALEAVLARARQAERDADVRSEQAAVDEIALGWHAPGRRG